MKWVEVELVGFWGGEIDMIKIIAGNSQRINNKIIQQILKLQKLGEIKNGKEDIVRWIIKTEEAVSDFESQDA